MIEVKCLKFTYSAKLPKSSVSSYSFDGKFLDLVVNDHTVSPYLKLTSTSNDVSEYYSSDMIHGYIADLFNIVDCNVKETDNYIYQCYIHNWIRSWRSDNSWCKRIFLLPGRRKLFIWSNRFFYWLRLPFIGRINRNRRDHWINLKVKHSRNDYVILTSWNTMSLSSKVDISCSSIKIEYSSSIKNIPSFTLISLESIDILL